MKRREKMIAFALTIQIAISLFLVFVVAAVAFPRGIDMLEEGNRHTAYLMFLTPTVFLGTILVGIIYQLLTGNTIGTDKDEETKT